MVSKSSFSNNQKRENVVDKIDVTKVEKVILTGLAVSRSCTSSTILLVERRRGNLDNVSSLVI